MHVAMNEQDAGFGWILYRNGIFPSVCKCYQRGKMADDSIDEAVAHFSRCRWFNRLLYVALLELTARFWEETLLLRAQTASFSYHTVLVPS